MKSNKNIGNEHVALIEIGGSHDECLYSQMFALKAAGRKVFLICNTEIRKRNPQFECIVDDFLEVEFTSSKYKNYKIMRSVFLYLKREKMDKVVLNTAQGNNIRTLCLMALFSKIEFIGIIHTTLKFESSFTHKIISLKVKKMLLLSTYLLAKVAIEKGRRLDYFYPIRFGEKPLEKIAHEKTEITIIGGVENRRKDLEGFLKMTEGIAKNVQFTFLGKSELENDDVIAFKEKIRESGMSDQVKLYDDFVSQEEFNKQLEITDAILTLVHPETKSAGQYFNNQISGAVNIAFGNKIPLLIHEGYASIEEMKVASIYYDQQTFASMFPLSQELLNSVVKQMCDKKEYDAEFQENRYLEFLFT